MAKSQKGIVNATIVQAIPAEGFIWCFFPDVRVVVYNTIRNIFKKIKYIYIYTFKYLLTDASQIRRLIITRGNPLKWEQLSRLVPRTSIVCSHGKHFGVIFKMAILGDISNNLSALTSLSPTSWQVTFSFSRSHLTTFPWVLHHRSKSPLTPKLKANTIQSHIFLASIKRRHF